ncbi:hypothetical protein [Streptosporangium saharense]|uniref:hypothetical protein n=1 Tax=Streptosporangium saharense TaxID=1706840 RepID=UPI0036B37EC3
MPLGNVRHEPLMDILGSERFSEVTESLRDAFSARAVCGPDHCAPRCGPSCSPACTPQGMGQPCVPNKGCGPSYGVCNPDDRLCNPDRQCRPNKCRPTS